MTDQDNIEVITSEEPPKRSNAGMIALIIGLVVVCFCCGGILIFYFWVGDWILEILTDIFYINPGSIFN